MQVQTFKTTDEFFEAILGPEQHDAHMRNWLRHRGEVIQAAWLNERKRIESQPSFRGVRYAS